MNRREFLRLAAPGVGVSAVVGATGLNPLAPERTPDAPADAAGPTPTETGSSPTATPEPEYRLWSHDVRGDVAGFVTAGRGEELYVSIGASVYRIAGDSGRIEWDVASEQAIETPVGVSGSSIFAAGRQGRLLAVDRRTGNRRWFEDTDSFVPDSPRVYGGTVALPGRRVYGFDAGTGEQEWSSAERFTMPVALRSGRYVYAGSARQLAKIDLEDGTSVWNWNERPSTNAPSRNLLLDADRDVLFGTYNWTLFAVDAGDGSLLWTAEDSDPIRSLALLDDLLLYHVRTDAGNPKLGAIDLDDEEVRWEKIAPLDVAGWEYGRVTTDLFGRDGEVLAGTGTGHLVGVDAATGSLGGAAGILDDDVQRLHVVGKRAYLSGDRRLLGVDLSTALAGR